jgi:CHAD domain-containing protein
MTNLATATRALFQSIDSAPRAMTPSTSLSDEGAHEARKALKRARAALRILRDAMADTSYRNENAVLRDASHAVSPLRDARAELDVLISLRERYTLHEVVPLNSRLHERLERNRRRLRVARTVTSVRESRRRLQSILTRLHDGRKDVHSLRRIYRQGRKALRRAERAGTALALHELRKKSKYLEATTDILGKGIGRKLRKAGKRARRLGDWLGEHHDLVVLANDIRTNSHGLSGPSRRDLGAAIRRREARLQQKALALAADAYGRKPRAIL